MAVDRTRLAAIRADAEARVRALQAKPRPALPALTSPKLPTLPPITDPLILKARAERRRRRQRALMIVLMIVIALALLRFCECAPEPEPVVEPVAELVCPDVPECPTGPARPPPKKPTKKKPLKGNALKQERDLFAVPTTRTPAWLAALRLQVTARSLPLAVCFNGAEKPGALRWTTTVTPSAGAVADSELEPVLKGPALTSAQQQCVLGVLSAAYKLNAEGDDVGTRVSLILEF